MKEIYRLSDEEMELLLDWVMCKLCGQTVEHDPYHCPACGNSEKRVSEERSQAINRKWNRITVDGEIDSQELEFLKTALGLSNEEP